ncbi:MAG: pilus assembly protein PilZ [Gammaproteobacteria bacterium HGW-Gammaproteobacteria-3]|nr:MAG: pilus assembly protein PilZ [Gammaproteobacteria bacterium HGW-Gammaproteobacteria-3]
MPDSLHKIIERPQTESTQTRPNNPNFVTNPIRIAHLIETIMSPRICTVQIKGSKRFFSTSLLDFQPQSGSLLLDEISPKEGNSLIRISAVLKLSTFVNDIPLAFKTTIIDQNLKQGIPYYKAGLPERIHYPQRRKAPRVSIEANTLNFEAHTNTHALAMTGQVYDLSRDGLCINLAETSPPLERGHIIKNCRITLPDAYSITFDLSVRSVKNLRGKTQIGGYFLNMPSKCKNKLSLHFTFLERMAIRKYKN